MGGAWQTSDRCRSRAGFFLSLLGCLLVLGLVGCGSSGTPATPEKKLKIGLLITPKGLNDKGFNDLAYTGLKSAERKYGIQPVVIEPSTMNDQEACLRFFAAQKLDAVIAVGMAFLGGIRQVASENPQLRFLVIDSDISEGQIQGVAFREYEASLLCGYLAAARSRTGKIGFIGGVDIPVIRRFLVGFEQGAQLSASGAQVMTQFVGEDFSGFNKPDRAKDIAHEMYQGGCDVVFPAAGASGLGVISAAVQNKKFVIGVDMNQDSLAPGLVLTSLLKRVDTVVEDIVKTLVDGKGNEAVKKTYGLADGGVDLTDFQFSRQELGPEIISRVNELRQEVINRKVGSFPAHLH